MQKKAASRARDDRMGEFLVECYRAVERMHFLVLDWWELSPLATAEPIALVGNLAKELVAELLGFDQHALQVV